jgi:hypothetical protein
LYSKIKDLEAEKQVELLDERTPLDKFIEKAFENNFCIIDG